MYDGTSPYSVPPRTAPIAFRYGAIFGAIIAGLGVGNTLIQNYRQSVGPSGSGLALFSCVWFIATLGLLFAAGSMAARQNGRLAAGTWAGAIAAAIPALVLGIVLSFQALATELSKNQPNGSAVVIGYGIGILIVIAILLLIAGGIGAGLGVLGALLGRGQYRSAHPQAYQPYPAYGAPYAPYPPYGASPSVPVYPGMPPSPYPPYSPYPPPPPYSGYPSAGQYPPGGTLASPYGQAPVYPPPPPTPYAPTQARPDYPPTDASSGASWRASEETEPPASQW